MTTSARTNNKKSIFCDSTLFHEDSLTNSLVGMDDFSHYAFDDSVVGLDATQDPHAHLTTMDSSRKVSVCDLGKSVLQMNHPKLLEEDSNDDEDSDSDSSRSREEGRQGEGDDAVVVKPHLSPSDSFTTDETEYTHQTFTETEAEADDEPFNKRSSAPAALQPINKLGLPASTTTAATSPKYRNSYSGSGSSNSTSRSNKSRSKSPFRVVGGKKVWKTLKKAVGSSGSGSTTSSTMAEF